MPESGVPAQHSVTIRTAGGRRDRLERLGPAYRRPRNPLAAATIRRIRAGLQQFAQPTMIATNHGSHGEDRTYPAAGAPMPTRSTKIGDGVACPPFLLDRRAYNDGDARRINRSASRSGPSQPMAVPHTLVSPPMIIPAGGSWNQTATSAADPIRTRMTRETDGLFTPQPWITVLRNHAYATPITDPRAAVATGGGHQGLTVPPGAFIQKHHGGLDYQRIAHMTKSVDDPLPSIVARPNLSLVIPYRKGKAKTTDAPAHRRNRRVGLLVALDAELSTECEPPPRRQDGCLLAHSLLGR